MKGCGKISVRVDLRNGGGNSAGLRCVRVGPSILAHHGSGGGASYREGKGGNQGVSKMKESVPRVGLIQRA